MRKIIYNVCSYPFFLAVTFSSACQGQQRVSEENQPTTELFSSSDTLLNPQIADYIRHIFQDKNGNLWFGTGGYGVAFFNGDRLSYYSNAQGFGGQQITGIAEDPEKNIWFATDQGVVKFDWTYTQEGSKQFTNYSSPKYFGGQRFWSIFADHQSNIWAGAESGIFHFDGISWSRFDLPYPEEVTGEFITKGTTWSISADGEGNIWFSTNGFGAFKYDGQSFTQYTERDGLTNNHVDHILEDSNGHIWFGTRHGGVSRFDGESFVNFTQKDGSIGNDEVCIIFEDRAGDIWFSSEGYGVYRYNGDSLVNYNLDDGLGVRAVQTIFEDREGRFWVGGGGGLYRFDGASFFQVTRSGPWN